MGRVGMNGIKNNATFKGDVYVHTWVEVARRRSFPKGIPITVKEPNNGRYFSHCKQCNQNLFAPHYSPFGL